MAQLSLKHVYKIYDNGTKAVNDFNLDIGDDEFIVFVGPSGCGKSTTLRMIAGLEDITAGDLFIDGVLSNALEPKDRDMAMVFQNYALYPHMSVYENMAFGLKIRHIPKDEIDRRVNEAAKILDIADQLDKKPKAMSGGQRQRVALGRAIVRKPRVFLLDEPLSNLDAKLRSSMRSEITRLHNVLKTTFIYVTHDQVEAMTMGSKIVVMKQGVIQQVDSPMNLYDYPANEFVAGFIGTPQMNFINARTSLDKENLLIALPNKTITCPLDLIKKFNIVSAVQNREVVVGIRPEHISISDKKDKNSFECEIAVVEALGNESNLICDSVEGGIHLTLKILRNDSLKVGDKIYVSLDLSKVHIFDKETTETLLPRIPKHSDIFISVKNGFIESSNGKSKLSPYVIKMLNGNDKVLLSISEGAIIEGKEFAAKIINKECINKKWLYTIQVEGGYIHYYSNKYFDGEDISFGLDLSQVEIYNLSGDLLLNHLDENNIVGGQLSPFKRKLPYLKSTPINEAKLLELEKQNYLDESNKKMKVSYKLKNVFKYSLLGQEIEPSLDATNKIYALLGKKFYLHKLNYSLPINKIRLAKEDDKLVFIGTVIESISYDKTLFYKLRVGEHTIIIPNLGEFKENDEVKFTIDVNDIGVNDVDFGVKII